MTSIDIGKRIKQVRDSLTMNQRDFSARLNTSSGYISGVESGKNMPGGDFLLRMKTEFDVDLNWLLTGVSATGQEGNVPALRPDEAALLDNYRHSSPEAQAALKATSLALAQSKGLIKRGKVA